MVSINQPLDINMLNGQFNFLKSDMANLTGYVKSVEKRIEELEKKLAFTNELLEAAESKIEGLMPKKKKAAEVTE